MTLRGFHTCRPCDGTGWQNNVHGDYSRPDANEEWPCPDCVGGWQPDPAVVEAVAQDLSAVRWRPGLPVVGVDRRLARAALLAYARKAKEKL